jgi:malate/lactate dehydrogenase
VVPWSGASIAGYALEDVLLQAQLARIEGRVAHLWPPGPYALGAAAARVVSAILESARRSFNVLTILDREFGARNLLGAVPALLGPRGIVHTRVPPLSSRERVRVDTALGT